MSLFENTLDDLLSVISEVEWRSPELIKKMRTQLAQRRARRGLADPKKRRYEFGGTQWKPDQPKQSGAWVPTAPTEPSPEPAQARPPERVWTPIPARRSRRTA